MKKLADLEPQRERGATGFVELYESADGALYLVTDESTYPGMEQLEAGVGLTLFLLPALGMLSALGLGDEHRAIPTSTFDDPDTGEFQAPGELVAFLDARTHPDDSHVVIHPFRCGNAARRLLGLPTLP